LRFESVIKSEIRISKLGTRPQGGESEGPISDLSFFPGTAREKEKGGIYLPARSSRPDVS